MAAALKLTLALVLIAGIRVNAKLSSRYLLQASDACVPGSTNPNTCYNAPGTAFTCCPGQCSNNPGPAPACAQSEVTPTPSASVGNSNSNVTQTGGVSLAKPRGSPTLFFIEVATTASTIVSGNLNTSGPSIFERNKVLDVQSGEQIGFTTRFARQTVGPDLVPLGSFEQDTLYHVKIGSSSITADGLFSQKTTATLAIMGGTGAYSFAQGTIVVDKVGVDGAGNTVFKGYVYLL